MAVDKLSWVQALVFTTAIIFVGAWKGRLGFFIIATILFLELYQHFKAKVKNGS